MVPKYFGLALITMLFFLIFPPVFFIGIDVARLIFEEPAKLQTLISKPYFFINPLKNSIVVCSISSAISTLIGLTLAWIIVRRNLPRKELLLTLLTGPYVMPSFAMAIGWVLLWTKNGFFEKIFGVPSPIPPYGPLSMIIIFALHNYPLVLLNVYTGLMNLNPELEDVARIHGIPSSKISTKIVLPLLMPYILSGFILSFAYSISEFGAPAVLGIPTGYSVLTTMIYSFMTVAPIEYEFAELLSLVLTAIGISLIALNYYILRGKKFTTISGKAFRIEAKKPSRLGFIYAIFILLLVYMPILSVIAGSFIKTIGLPITPQNVGIDHFVRVLSLSRVISALSITLVVGVSAAIVASILGLFVAYFISREKGLLSRIMDLLVFAPFSIPGLVIGVGLIVASGRLYSFIYGTWVMLLIAFIIRFLPYASKTIESNLMQIDESLEESARVHGIGFFRTMHKVVLPLTKRALLSSWTFVFNSSMKELSASAILSVQVETAIVVAFMMFSEGFFGDGAALTSVIIAATLLVTFVANKLAKIKATEVMEI